MTTAKLWKPTTPLPQQRTSRRRLRRALRLQLQQESQATESSKKRVTSEHDLAKELLV
jgi:hypothetical protein